VRRLPIDPVRPDPAVLAQAADAVRAGGIIALPTDTVYGLAVDPFNAQAVQRLFAAKGRQLSRALPLIAADLAQLESGLGSLPPLGRLLAAQFWPGPLTILMKAAPAIPHDVIGGTGRVGVRVPDHAVARGLCRASERVLTATSANLSGQPAADRPDDLVASLGHQIDVLLDAGRTPGGPPSTIVDVSGGDVILVRSGAIDWEAVAACVRHVT
jgi:L-threonylcarbamoyladenylate synthase